MCSPVRDTGAHSPSGHNPPSLLTEAQATPFCREVAQVGVSQAVYHPPSCPRDGVEGSMSTKLTIKIHTIMCFRKSGSQHFISSHRCDTVLLQSAAKPTSF